MHVLFEFQFKFIDYFFVSIGNFVISININRNNLSRGGWYMSLLKILFY